MTSVNSNFYSNLNILIDEYSHNPNSQILDRIKSLLIEKFHQTSALDELEDLNNLKNKMIYYVKAEHPVINLLEHLSNPQQTSFSSLSKDILESIFSLLKIEDRHRAAAINKKCRLIFHYIIGLENAVWRVAKDFITKTESFRHWVQRLDFTHHKKLTDKELFDCLNSSRNLEILILKDCENLTNAGFQAMAGLLTKLRVIDLSNCQIEDTGLAAIGEHCRQLEVVNLSNCKNITDEGLKSFSKALTHVTNLNLSCCNVTDETLTTMAPFLTNLIKLDLSGGNFFGSSFKSLAIHCKKIEILNLNGCEEVNDDNLEKLIPALKNLKVLKLKICNINGKCFEAIGKNCQQLKELIIGGFDLIGEHFTDDHLLTLAPALKNIKVFEIHSGYFTGSCFQTLFQHSFGIEKLVFGDCDNLTDVNLSLLAPYLNDNLKELLFEKVSINGSCFNSIASNCQLIKKVSFSYCPNLKDEQLADLFKYLLNLKEIYFDNCPITGLCFKNFYSHFLEKVDLFECNNLRDDYLEALAPSMKKLKELQIVASSINGSCFNSFAKYSNELEKIDLSGCVNISDKNLANLALENLSELKLEHCKNLTGFRFNVFALHSPNLKKVWIATCENVQERYLMEILTLIKNYSNDEKMVNQIKHVFKLFFSSKHFSFHTVNIDKLGWFRAMDVKMEEYIQKHLQAPNSESSSDEDSPKRYKAESWDDT